MKTEIRGRVLKSVIKQYRNILILYVVFAAVMAGVLKLYQLMLEPLAYAMVLLLFVIAVMMVASYVMQYRKARRLEYLLHGIQSEWRNMPEPDTMAEEDYQNMIRVLGEELTQLSILRNEEKTEMVDYYSAWVHQVKTPIAVMHLLLHGEDTELNRSLQTELFRVEQYVEMALNYTRLDSDSSDLTIREYSLDDLLRQAIRKYASQFINKKIRLNYETVTETVVTDQKWFLCIVEQLLSNAVKYTREGSVTITVKDGLLRIEDTGIGIDPADLPRIFEKGFTGINGRAKEAKSSGLGLYLCKKAADLLNLKISAESEVGKGSIFSLSLKQEIF